MSAPLIAGIKTRPNTDSPYAWRVFVDDLNDLSVWLTVLGTDSVVEHIAGAPFEHCEAGRLYSWGEAPVQKSSPPAVVCGGGDPMWHPRHSRSAAAKAS
jgi:hypothetical protein